MGNAQNYVSTTWEENVRLAKAHGIDAFVLNVGHDASDATQMDLAYTAAETVGDFYCFISLDMSYASLFGSASDIIATYITPLASRAGQFKYEGKAFLSTFSGEVAGTFLEGNSNIQEAWASFKAASPVELYFVPEWTGISGSTSVTDHPVVDGIGQWLAWPTGDANPTTDIDITFQKDALSNSRTYMAPVSPWFYKHLTPGAGGNYIYRSDDFLLATRFEQLIAMDTLPDFIEVISWNDFGESHYIGPMPSEANFPAAGSISSTAYTKSFHHQSMLGLVSFYSQWYKSGTFPKVSKTAVYWWYRPHLKDAVASSDPLGSPLNAEWTDDLVYAAVILGENSLVTSVQITSGVKSDIQTLKHGVVNKVTAQLKPGSQEIVSLASCLFFVK